MAVDPRSRPPSVEHRLEELQDPALAKRLLSDSPEFFAAKPTSIHNRTKRHWPLAVALIAIASVVAAFFLQSSKHQANGIAHHQARSASADIVTKRLRQMQEEITRARVEVAAARAKAAHAEALAQAAQVRAQVTLQPRVVPRAQTLPRVQVLPQTQTATKAQAEEEQQTWLRVAEQVRAKERAAAAKTAAAAAAAAAAANPPVVAAGPPSNGGDVSTPNGPAQPQNVPPPRVPGGRCGHGRGGLGNIFGSVLRHVVPGGIPLIHSHS
jgi:hypothetical protein